MWTLLILACASTPEASSPAAPDAAPVAPAATGTRENTDLAGLEKALAAGAFVVDVRTDGEWQSGHVPGAKHLPLSDVRADHPLFTEHGKDAPIYVICESGGRSGRAADLLAGAGFHAVNVQGGTGAWRSAGKPLETP